MKRDNINYFAVGLFVLVLLTAFFIALYKITGRTGPTDQYYVTYQNVAGIKYGTAVLYEGFQIGQVEDIEPTRDSGQTRYKLKFTVIKDWQIPEDSIAKIIASGLLAAISINIYEGSSTVALNPGDFIKGREAASIFAAVNEVAADLHELSRDGIRPLIDNVNTHIDAIAKELTGLITEDVRPMVSNINKELEQNILDDLKTLLDSLNDGAARLVILLDDDNQENVEHLLTNMDQASGTLNNLLLRMEGTRASMDNILGNINSLVETNEGNINASITDMRNSLDIVAQHINAIIHHMEGSSRNIHELSRQVRENPSLILKGSPQPNEGEQ
ncbi:MAG: MlaD family protein [Gammaproteobacteria bacterium]